MAKSECISCEAVRCQCCGDTYMVPVDKAQAPLQLWEMRISGMCPACWTAEITIPEIVEEYGYLTSYAMMKVIELYHKRQNAKRTGTKTTLEVEGDGKSQQ